MLKYKDQYGIKISFMLKYKDQYGTKISFMLKYKDQYGTACAVSEVTKYTLGFWSGKDRVYLRKGEAKKLNKFVFG